jgi:hypothetical protein
MLPMAFNPLGLCFINKKEEEKDEQLCKRVQTRRDGDHSDLEKRRAIQYLLGTLLLSNFIPLLAHISQPCPRAYQLPPPTKIQKQIRNQKPTTIQQQEIEKMNTSNKPKSRKPNPETLI